MELHIKSEPQPHIKMEAPALAGPTSNGACLGDILNLPPTIDLLEDVDFESTMMMLDNDPTTAATTSGASLSNQHFNSLFLSSSSRSNGNASTPSTTRHDMIEPLDLSLTNLNDLFPSADDDDLNLLDDETNASTAANAANSNACLSPDLKLRVNARGPSFTSQSGGPELSPVMDSFLRESWEEIQGVTAKSTRNSLKVYTDNPAASTAVLNATNLALSTLAMPPNYVVPAPSHVPQPASFYVSPSLPAPATATRSTASSSTKAPRKAKQCVFAGCTRRAQSNNRCKTHGGGARCQIDGCDKSSQGGGLCRAHGGGKKCRVPGCTKGTQRLGLCYLHGGIRRCITEGCKKKDRGNGYCISHGGGRRCEVPNCNRSVRKGNHCQTHQGMAPYASASAPSTTDNGDESPFKISRGQTLAFP